MLEHCGTPENIDSIGLSDEAKPAVICL